MKMEQLFRAVFLLSPAAFEVSLLLNLSFILKVLKSDWIRGVLAFSGALALTLHADSG